jgi:hypothetical protein
MGAQAASKRNMVTAPKIGQSESWRLKARLSAFA